MIKRGERIIAVAADAAYVGDGRRQGMKISTLYPERRHLRDRVAELGGEGLAQSERGQGVRRLHAEPRRCRSCSRSEFLYSARTDVAGPGRLSAALLDQDAPDRLRLHRGGKPAHPQAVRGGDAVAGVICVEPTARGAAASGATPLLGLDLADQAFAAPVEPDAAAAAGPEPSPPSRGCRSRCASAARPADRRSRSSAA